MTDWAGVIEAVTAAAGGQEGGRQALLDRWAATTEADHAQRCVLAHYLADHEPVLADEVAWDERALAEHALVADDALAAIGIPSARGLAPSLHLNLGDGYLRQGRADDAGRQLAAGLAAADALGDDGYGDLVRRGLEGLAARLSPSP